MLEPIVKSRIFFITLAMMNCKQKDITLQVAVKKSGQYLWFATSTFPGNTLPAKIWNIWVTISVLKLADRYSTRCSILSFNILSTICFFCSNHVYWNEEKHSNILQANMIYKNAAVFRWETRWQDFTPRVTFSILFKRFSGDTTENMESVVCIYIVFV